MGSKLLIVPRVPKVPKVPLPRVPRTRGPRDPRSPRDLRASKVPGFFSFKLVNNNSLLSTLHIRKMEVLGP